MMTPKNILPRTKIADFIDNLYDGDLHAKRVLSLANATLGVLVSASLAVHAIGQGMAQALGKLSKHGVKQVDRLLSNQGVDVWEFFGYWIPYLPASCITFLSEQAFAPQNTRFWSRSRVWFQFTVGEDKPPMLSVDNRGKGVLSMDCSAKRSPL